MNRTIACGLLALVAAGFSAPSLAPPSPSNRRIEVAVRSHFSVPTDVNVSIGAESQSSFSGYQNLPITFSKDGKASTIDFLLSNDGNTLARLQKIDISRNPADVISTLNRPMRGFPDAKVTVVSFDDLECPYCAQMHALLFSQTAAHYQGLVRFVYKDYPLEQHPWAMHAAVDANCLAAQSGDAYWSFVDYVHSHAQEMGGKSNDLQTAFKTLDSLAHDQGQRSKLDLATLDSCTAKQEKAVVQASMKEAEGLGVNSTPTLFVNGERVVGVVPAETLRLAIDRALSEAGVQPPPQSAPATAPNKVGTAQ